MMDIDSFTITSNILKILYKQQCELEKYPPDCVKFHINQSNLLDIQADIIGPKATPYENGIFSVKLEIPYNFPNNPPKGYFLTKIFHPNISEKGDICVNALKKDWNPSQWNLYNLFEIIKCLLIIPFPQSALNEEAGKLFMENYDEYFKIAKMYTNIYAMKNNNQNISQGKNINENNDDDIEMDDQCEKNNSISGDNNIYNSFSNFSQSEMKVCGNNFRDNIELEIVRRRSEIPRCHYNLDEFNYNFNNDMNKYNDETKRNNNFMCKSNNICDNNNNFSNGNNINVSNNPFSNYQSISSKEKPNLSFLPLMQANQIKNNNNLFGYHRSFTDINIANNNRIGNGYNNNSKEINKWIMRI